VRFLITAGPTREPIDPVRFLSNRSSGKMGYAIAEAAIDDGHDVILISGPVNLSPPRGSKFIRVVTGDEMYQAVAREAANCDVIVLCAAVTDYKPAQVSGRKMKKTNENLSLDLVPVRDILAALGKEDRKFLLVGFAAETDDVEENARKKLRAKNADVIVANDVSGADSGIESDENEVMILFRNGEMKKISRTSKKNVARQLLKIFANTQ
jgi:phosphopantothenoylcysteine decarboxylase/phosphopantothenate--cysteine ligase